MKGGNVNEFVDHLHYGDEEIFVYNGQKFFIQGWFENGIHTLGLDRWNPPSNDYIWIKESTNGKYPVEEFLKEKIFAGKSFWEIEAEIDWVDD